MTRAAVSLVLASSAFAAPTLMNPGFESGLSGWTASSVAVESGFSQEGTHRLDLQNGSLEQAITGLTPGVPHTVRIAYLAQSGTGDLAEARVLLDGTELGFFRTKQDNEYLAPNGFEFTPASTTALLRIESLETGSEGLLIDDIRVNTGTFPDPPAESWDNLTPVADARGGRRLVNGDFEAPIGDPATDPDNSGPVGNEHLTGDSLPGWRVTRENVDVIYAEALPPQGAKVLDLNGHGPGAIAQTITGLSPGGAYTLSFLHARHRYWGTDPMTAELLANGETVATLVRTSSQTWDDGYELAEVPCLAGADGTLALELRSTVLDQGGGIVYDDFRISSGADFFTPWASANGATPDPEANDDHDPFANGLEFLLGYDPGHAEPSLPFVPTAGGFELSVPLDGTARAQGFDLDLESSTDLSTWLSSTDPLSGIAVDSDSSAPGTNGTRTYLIDDSPPRRFVRLHLLVP